MLGTKLRFEFIHFVGQIVYLTLSCLTCSLMGLFGRDLGLEVHNLGAKALHFHSFRCDFLFFLRDDFFKLFFVFTIFLQNFDLFLETLNLSIVIGFA